MRKCILAFVALLILSSAAWAAFFMPQTYLPAVVPQLTCNLTTGVASANSPCVSPVAACNGDVQTVTRTISISSGTAILTATASTWASGDAGKTIRIAGAGFSGGELITTILTFTSATQVTLASNASTTLSSVSTTFTFGTDDAPRFMAFNLWARTNQGANQVVLNGASGANCWFGTAAVNTGVVPGNIGNIWAAGIKNLLVDWPGANWNSNSGSGFQLGALAPCEKGLTDAAGCSARINTANPSDSTVTLTATSAAAGYISRFPVNQWIVIASLNVQASTTIVNNGQPQNLYNYEFRQVTANNGTNTLTLDRPLTKTFLSTLPEYNQGDAFRPDPGGPATIWAMAGSIPEMWGYTVEVKGAVGNPLVIDQSGQTYMGIRNFTMRNVRFSNGGGGTPSVNENWSAYNVDYTGLTMEVDKLIGTMTVDGMTISQLKFQSPSPDLFVGRNLTVGNFTGGGKRTEIYNSTITNWLPGSYGYGASRINTIKDSAVTTFSAFGGVHQGNFGSYSKSSGVISILNSANTGGSGPLTLIFTLPNGNFLYNIAGSFAGPIGLDTVTALTQDPTNTFAQTSVAGGFPLFTSGAPGNPTCCVTISPHPSPQFTSDNSSGAVALQATNIQRGCPALAPLGQCANWDYAPTAQGSLAQLQVYGKLVKLSVNVTTASTHTGAITLNPTAQFGFETVDQSGAPAYVPFNFLPTINLKQTGLREITPTGVTCNGVAAPTGCAGDSIAATAPTSAIWIKNALGPYTSGGYSGGVNPQFNITIQTDQGVVP